LPPVSPAIRLFGDTTRHIGDTRATPARQRRDRQAAGWRQVRVRIAPVAPWLRDGGEIWCGGDAMLIHHTG
jgi:hypothetical protein